MADYISALGVCKKCGRDKIQAEDTIKCIFCDYDFTAPSGPVVNIPDPGEEEINRVLAASGVKVDFSKKAQKVDSPKVVNVPTNTIPQLAPLTGVDFNSHITNVLNVMEHLPMPRDIKQVKIVYKVIADLKKLLGE